MISVGGLSQAEALRATINPCSRQLLSRVINLLCMLGDTNSRGEGNTSGYKCLDNGVEDEVLSLTNCSLDLSEIDR